MAPSPPKPWERQTTSSAAPAASSSAAAVVATDSSNRAIPPPVPSRSYESTELINAANSSGYPSRYGGTYGGIGGYGGLSSYSSPYSRLGGYGGGMYGSSMYGGMGNSMYGYGGYGGYNGIGGYGGYGGFGGMGDPNDPNSLSRRMEAGTQATFQIIESIVGAFGGFAQMLESTFMATHSSFFAMVSVAEQFGNLRDTLGSIFGIYAMMRHIRRLIARLRGQPLPPEPDETEMHQHQPTDPNAPPVPQPSKKPLVIFLLAVFGLPYLMGKLIRAMAALHSQPMHSRSLDISSAQLYRAIFDYIPRNAAAEIPLRKGDIVAIVQRTDAGWWRARLRDGREGFVPATYLEAVHNPTQAPPPIMSPPGEKGHAFIEEFKETE